MIKQLKLSNFRLFDDEVTVRFRPITVLIGRNNAGKSSVIKFLLMLQQSRNDSAAEFLNPEGERVKLGSFKSLKNSISEKNSLHFEMDVQTSRPPKLLESIEGIQRKGERADVNGAERESKPAQRSEAYQETQANFMVMATVPYNRARSGNIEIKIKNSGEFHTEWKEKIRRNSLSFINEITRIDKILRTKKRLPSEKIIPKKYLSEMTKDISAKDISKMNKYLSEMERDISKMAKDISEMSKELNIYIYLSALIREIENIKHIYPTRVSFSRVIELAPPPSDYVGQNGEYAILHLQRLMEKPNEQSDILSEYLGSIVDVENLAFKNRALGPLKHITALATNRKTKAHSYLSEFGFGVSQVIPVLVQGVLMNPYTQLMIEQPEAQLHPTAQLELGSYFADIWKKRQVGSIIETHSGNILLRLRRLIAKGDLKPEDVSVAFFDIEEGEPIVKNLDIDSDGSMQEGLPMEFFGADIREALKLGAKE